MPSPEILLLTLLFAKKDTLQSQFEELHVMLQDDFHLVTSSAVGRVERLFDIKSATTTGHAPINLERTFVRKRRRAMYADPEELLQKLNVVKVHYEN